MKIVQDPLCACLTHSSKSSDSTCNCSGDGQSICSGSIDIEYIPPPTVPGNSENAGNVEADEVNVKEEEVTNVILLSCLRCAHVEGTLTV